MSKPVSIGQSHNVISVLINNVDWGALDGEILQRQIVNNPTEAGRQFTLFLQNGGRVAFAQPQVISIDRSKPFDPVEFLGEGWKIGEQDERAEELTEIDLSLVRLVHTLEPGESWIKGEKRLSRLKAADYIRLDAAAFLHLWENQNLIPEAWKERTSGNTTFVFFDGTILLSPGGGRYVLCLYWDGGRWYWDYYWLEDGFDAYGPSAVLAS